MGNDLVQSQSAADVQSNDALHKNESPNCPFYVDDPRHPCYACTISYYTNVYFGTDNFVPCYVVLESKPIDNSDGERHHL